MACIATYVMLGVVGTGWADTHPLINYTEITDSKTRLLRMYFAICVSQPLAGLYTAKYYYTINNVVPLNELPG